MATPKLKVTALALFTLASCSQILGLDDYSTDPSLDPASGGDGNEGGEGKGGSRAGSDNKGGEPGMAGEPGMTGEAGMGGQVGSSGGGGEAGSGDTPGGYLGCNGMPFEGSDAIVRSCILRVGCLPWAWPTDTISRCISQNAQAAYQGTQCTLDAKTCDDVAECEGRYLDFSDFCLDKEDGSYCNGEDLVICGFYNHVTNCEKYGGACHDFGVDIDGDPANEFNATADCGVPAVTTCTKTTATEVCGGPNNDYLYRCEGTVALGTKCGNFAASCKVEDTVPGCYYPTNTCNLDGVTCTNERATVCDGESKTKVTFDCASVGLGCETAGDFTEDNERECAAPGCSAEDLVKCKESCDGSKLTFCYGGAPVQVDCKDYGFSACNEYEFQCAEDNLINDCVYVDDLIPFAQCE